jgi:hypothetical protein
VTCNLLHVAVRLSGLPLQSGDSYVACETILHRLVSGQVERAPREMNGAVGALVWLGCRIVILHPGSQIARLYIYIYIYIYIDADLLATRLAVHTAGAVG